MSIHKVEERANSLNNSSFDLTEKSLQNLNYKQFCDMGACVQSPSIEETGYQNASYQPVSWCQDSFACLEGGSPQTPLTPLNFSSRSSNRFQLQSPACYLTDSNMDLHPHVYHIGRHPLEYSSCASYGARSSSNWPTENEMNLQNFSPWNSNVRSPSYNSHSLLNFGNSGRYEDRTSEEQFSSLAQIKRTRDEAFSGGRLSDSNVNSNILKSSVAQTSLLFTPEKPLPFGLLTTSSNVSSGVGVSNKTRIRWTQDLHEKFVESVNQLGGAEKATPKGILKSMDYEGLTIFHVKSHLQKYRIAKYVPESTKGKPEKRSSMSDMPQLDLKTGVQITEALRLQLDVQRRLHEQLEVQRKLQMQIEEQGKQLQKMFDEQLKTKKNLLENQNLDIMFSEEQSVSFETVPVPVPAIEDKETSHFHSKIS